MIKNKIRKLLTVILAILCAMLLCCSVAVFNGIINKAAKAVTNYTFNLTPDGTLDTTALYDLFGKITDKTTATYEDVEDWLKGNSAKGIAAHGKVNAKSSDNSTLAVRYDEFGNTYTVNFGGIEWQVVYLTTNIDGELVLTLWQKTHTVTSGFSYGGMSAESNTSLNNPSQVYGTSYVRSVTLGNGGMYYNYSNASSPQEVNDPNAGSDSVYKEFATGKYSQLLDAPAKIAYQETESAPTSGTFKYNYPNDAYGTPTVNNQWTKDGLNYGSVDKNGNAQTMKKNYDVWKHDKIWLPSWAEIGSIGNGASCIWGTSSTGYTDILKTKNYWIRTGYEKHAGKPFIMNSNGTEGSSWPNANTEQAIRPAIHLNLKMLGLTEPEDLEKEYQDAAYTRKDISGNWYYPDLMDVDWPDDDHMLNVGVNKIKVTLNTQAKNKGLKFNGTPAANEDDYTRYFTFTITKRNVKLEWGEDKHVSDSAYFMLPTLNLTPELQSLLKDNGEVKYYLEGDYDKDKGEPKSGTEAVALEDIQTGLYYVAAVEKITDARINNYEFSGLVYRTFDTTDNRTLVYVSPTKTKDEYQGTPLPTDVIITDKNGVALPGISYELTYEDSDGNALSGYPRNAGTYSVKVSLLATSIETYKIGEKKFTYVIEKATPTLNWIYADEEPFYEGCELPEIVFDEDEGGTPGEYVPDVGQLLASGKDTYTYTFIPAEPDNYKTVTLKIDITAEAGSVTGIEATFDPTKNGEPVTVYSTWSETEIKQYLKVYTLYSNGGRSEVKSKNKYRIEGLPLTAGDDSVITVIYDGNIHKCNVPIKNVVLNVLEEITDVVKTGNLYTSHSVNDLRSILTVYGKYLDGSTVPLTDYNKLSIEVDSKYVDENGMLKAGTNITVTVKYVDDKNGNEEHTKVTTVNVDEVKLTSLSVEFDNGPYEITATTDKATLLECLTVTAHYNNKKTEEIELTEDDIIVEVNGTTLTITVTRDGISESYDVTVPEEENVKTFTLTVPNLVASYTGEEIDILKDWQFANLIASGDVEVSGNKETNAGPYNLTITIKNTAKYKWPEVAKQAMRYALADDEAEVGYTIEGATLTATWKIAKAVVKGSWNDQGTLDLVCDGYTGNVNSLVNYTYFKDGEEVDPTTLVIGETYTVTAELADTENFALDADTEKLLSEPHEFKMTAKPTGGIQAVWNAMNKKLWVLPLWAWIAIGLALLILLIIIIAVACKRRKNKEQRKEEKARRDEERKFQQEKLQAERDLAKAKQEAELEKIRLQAQAGMAGAGMASMAMHQAMPTQMPQQQPVQQQQQMQQPVQAQMQMQPMIQSMPQQMQQGQPMMQQGAPAQTSGGIGATEMMAMMFAQLAGMKADSADKEIAALRSEKEIAKLKTELEIMKLKMENLKDSKSASDLHDLTPEFIRAALASAMRNNGYMPQSAVAELPAPETETTTSSAVYPPDAVVTTTTTVDTTKSRNSGSMTGSVERRAQSGDDFDDVDGFYDSID